MVYDKQTYHREYMRKWREKNRAKYKAYQAQYFDKYYAEHKDRIINQTRKYYDANKDSINARKKEYFEENKDYFVALKKKYWRDNKHILGPKNKARYEANSARYNKNTYKNYKKPRYHSDPDFRLGECIGACIRSTLRYETNKKESLATEYIGCSIKFLKDYLTKLFLPGMAWDNFGRGGWVIDHIIPRKSFAKDRVSQLKCWNYTNLRPLWEKDNIRKSISINYISDAECAVLMSIF